MDARPARGCAGRRVPYKGAETRRTEAKPGMTQLTDATPTAARNNDARIIPLVCAAHFVSHFYILVLPPLFPFIRDFYGVSYTAARLRADRVQHHHRAVPDAGRLPGRPDRRALGAGRRACARRRVPRGRRAVPVVLAAGRDVRAARRRERRLPSGRLRDPVATRLERARQPGLLAPHLRGLSRHRGDAGHDADPAAGARLAGRVRRGLGDGPGRRDPVPAAAGRAVRAAAKAGAPAERAAEGRQGRLVAAAVGADPAQSPVLRDDHVLDHRRAELFGGRAQRGLRHADRHRQHGADREPDAQRVRRAGGRAAGGAHRRGPNGSRPARSSASR